MRIHGQSTRERAGRPLSYANVVATLALVLVVTGGTAIGGTDGTLPNDPHNRILSAVSAVQQDVGAIRARMDEFEGVWEKTETAVIPRLVDLEQKFSDHNANSFSEHTNIVGVVLDKVLPRLFSLCEGQYRLSRDFRQHDLRNTVDHTGTSNGWGAMEPWIVENSPSASGSRKPWQYCYRILPPGFGQSFGNEGPQG